MILFIFQRAMKAPRFVRSRESSGMHMVDLNSLEIEPRVLKLISKKTALELSVLPISQKNDTVLVAVPDIFRKNLMIDIHFVLGKRKVKPIPVSRDNIIAAIHHFYGPVER